MGYIGFTERGKYVTWSDATTQFLESRQERSAAVRTLQAYGEDLAVFAGWHQRERGVGVHELGDVTPLTLARYREWLASRCKPATVNRRLSALRSLFAWATSEGHLAQTPAGHLRPMAQVALGPRALDRDKVARLVDAAGRRSRRDAVLITLLAQTGLRISEALALTWGHVQVGKDAGMIIVERGKGAKYREVPLNATARRALLVWRGLRWPDGTKPPEPVFPSRTGRALARRTAEELFVRYSRAAGIDPPATPHVLRHTFCKALVDAGESLDRVAALAGHARLDTTALYTRPTRADLERAVGRLDQP